MNNDNDPRKLLLDFMEDYNLAQTELAGMLGISVFTINRWLHKKVEHERLVLLALATLYMVRGNIDKGLSVYRIATGASAKELVQP